MMAADHEVVCVPEIPPQPLNGSMPYTGSPGACAPTHAARECVCAHACIKLLQLPAAAKTNSAVAGTAVAGSAAAGSAVAGSAAAGSAVAGSAAASSAAARSAAYRGLMDMAVIIAC